MGTKKIKDVSVKLTTINDEPVAGMIEVPGVAHAQPFTVSQAAQVAARNAKEGDVPPAVPQAEIKMGDFLRGRIVDPVFSGKSGMDAVFVCADAKMELKEQRAKAEARGYWLFDAELCECFQRAPRNPTGGYNPAIQHCLVDLVRAIDKAEDVPASELEQVKAEPAAHAAPAN